MFIDLIWSTKPGHPPWVGAEC